MRRASCRAKSQDDPGLGGKNIAIIRWTAAAAGFRSSAAVVIRRGSLVPDRCRALCGIDCNCREFSLTARRRFHPAGDGARRSPPAAPDGNGAAFADDGRLQVGVPRRYPSRDGAGLCIPVGAPWPKGSSLLLPSGFSTRSWCCRLPGRISQDLGILPLPGWGGLQGRIRSSSCASHCSTRAFGARLPLNCRTTAARHEQSSRTPMASCRDLVIRSRGSPVSWR